MYWVIVVSLIIYILWARAHSLLNTKSFGKIQLRLQAIKKILLIPFLRLLVLNIWKMISLLWRILLFVADAIKYLLHSGCALQVSFINFLTSPLLSMPMSLNSMGKSLLLLAHLAHSAKVSFLDRAVSVVRPRASSSVRRPSCINNLFKHLLRFDWA